MKKYLVPIVSVVALVVGLLGLFLPSVSPSQSPALNGVVDIKGGGASFPNGADFGGPSPVTVNWAGDKIYAKNNQASWLNTTGQTQYADDIEFSTDGTASSTYKVYAVATTTALRTLYDFVAPVGGLVGINGFSFATSTTATTTSSADKAFAGKIIRVPDGTRINFYLQAVDLNACGVAKTCQTAPSTNRGFNAFWRIRYHN